MRFIGMWEKASRINGIRERVAISRRTAAFVIALAASLSTAGCIGLTGTPAGAGGSGSGIAAGAQLSPSSSSVSFGPVAIGSSTSELVTLTAAGTKSVRISKATASGTSFTVSGPSNITLTPGQSVTISVGFQPKATGNATGTLLISSNASNSSLQIALSGEGVTASTHTVALNWQGSASPVTGYFVFRGTSTSTLAQLNATALATTSYLDRTVVNGVTYVYAVKSIDSNNVLSNFSNTVMVKVPSQ
jgi:hypothetical protein